MSLNIPSQPDILWSKCRE